MDQRKKKSKAQKAGRKQKRGNVSPSIVDLGRAAYPANKRSGDGIDGLVQKGMLSEDGANWLTMAIDPFHDYKKPMAGYPDIDPSGSTVICKKFTVDIVAPGAVEWDAHIFSTPVSRAQRNTFLSAVGASGGSYAQAALNTYFATSTLTIVSADSGSVLYPTGLAWAPVNVNTDTVPAPGDDSLLNGTTRVVAAGFEVVNTTPEMYRGGRALVYSMPQCDEVSHIKVTDATAGNLIDGATELHQARSPPGTPALAAQYLGSRSWAAAEGAYVPIPLRKMDNPYRTANSTAFSSRLSNSNTSDMVCTKLFGGAEATMPFSYTDKETALGSVGLFLTGLSPQSTFTLTLRLFIEKIPSHDEPELCALASPSACYDQTALKLYSYLLSKLPVGVEVAANAHGDWFRAILKTIYSVARPIAGLFPGGGRAVDRIYAVGDKVVSTAGGLMPFLP